MPTDRFSISKNELEYMYHNLKLSQSEIARKCGIKEANIFYWMNKHQVERRPVGEILSKSLKGVYRKRHASSELTKEILEDLYINKKLSPLEIAEAYSINNCTVRYWLLKYEIPIRTLSQALKGKPLSEKALEVNRRLAERAKTSKLGDKNPNWKGGVSLWRTRLSSNSKYTSWRKEILLRDNNSCQSPFCFRKSKLWDVSNIKTQNQVHHIVTVVSLREKYKPKTYFEFLEMPELFDISNGITLCNICHGLVTRHEKAYEKVFKKVLTPIIPSTDNLAELLRLYLEQEDYNCSNDELYKDSKCQKL